MSKPVYLFAFAFLSPWRAEWLVKTSFYEKGMSKVRMGQMLYFCHWVISVSKPLYLGCETSGLNHTASVLKNSRQKVKQIYSQGQVKKKKKSNTVRPEINSLTSEKPGNLFVCMIPFLTREDA